jgi:hypothetical protein
MRVRVCFNFALGILESVYKEFKRLGKQVEGFDTESALETVETMTRIVDIDL